MRVQPLRVQVEHSAAAVGKSTLVRGNPRLVGPCRASISATPPLHSWAHALSWLRQKPVDKSLCVPGYRCFLCSRSFPMSIDTTLKTLKGRRNLTPLLFVHPCTFSPGFLLYYSNLASSRPLTDRLSYSPLPRGPCTFLPQAMPPYTQS